MCAPIVNLRHLRAQPSDINRKISEQLFAPELIKHGERFLRFSQGKNWNEHAAAPTECFIDRQGESVFFGLTREVFRKRIVAPRGFHNQHINSRLGKNSSLGDGLIVEIDVSAIEKGASFSAEKNSSGAEHVS